MLKSLVLIAAALSLGLVDSAAASFADDLSTDPDRLVFDDLSQESEAKRVKVTNNGAVERDLAFETTGSSAFRTHPDAYCHLDPGDSCLVSVQYDRGTRAEDRGTLVIKNGGPPSEDTTTENVALIGRTEARVPRCAVSLDRSQTLISDGGRARRYRIGVRQNMRGEIGLFTKAARGMGGTLFGGEGDFAARPGVTLKRSFALTRTSRREIIQRIKSGATPQYRLSVYCRAIPGRTRHLQYTLTFRDDRVDRRFRGALVATAKLRSSRAI